MEIRGHYYLVTGVQDRGRIRMKAVTLEEVKRRQLVR